MFGDLFEEDFSFISNHHCGKAKKSKPRDFEPPAPRDFTNLSGIKNQGGTCYLNSLLQTLLFTPEFREALFSLGPEELGTLDDSSKPDAKVRIIPLQLQRLFAQLLLLDQQAASTTDLTESFGWNSHEEMRQHDVQELNRILFSALETSLVGTSGHDLINRLYHGIVVNQIVCKECKNISERQEDFLDLTVTVKGVSGLEEALWNTYVEEEHFENENLYRCGACDKLVEASKSAKLRKLPPFLTISLLRFNFDFEKCERYKETSCYTFPSQINLRPFCEQTEMDDSEYMYELFSVIIHKGGCYGGHYHVYVRDVDELGNWQLQPLFSSFSIIFFFPPQKNDVQWDSEKNPPRLKDSSAGCHWFDLNDSKVQPIKEKDIEKQFEGKESAYMLFYRKSQLKRPAEARGNPRYKIPTHLLNEMNAANTELQKKRVECDSANNGMDLHLHLSSCYMFHNGALHPALTWKESVVDLTIDRRKTLGDLRQSVFQMLESWEGDMVLSIAKPLPAGLHLYQILDGDELTLDGIGLADGADVFVWNGKEVGGTKVMTGPDHEPVVINVLRLAEYNEGGKGQHFTESQHVFSCSTKLGELHRALAPSGGIILKNLSGPEKEAKNWEVLLEEDMNRTVRSVGLTDGCSVLILDSHDQSFVNVSSGNLTAFTYDISWLQVKNFCRTGDEEKHVKITATIETVRSHIGQRHNTGCFPGKLVPEDYTVKEAELKMGSLLGLCHGKAPTSTQVYQSCGSNTKKHKNPLPLMERSVMACFEPPFLANAFPICMFLVGDNWHLRRIDWCYEAGEALSQELQSCIESSSGGFFSFPWRLAADTMEVFLFQALTLPCCQEQVVPLPSFLRAWTVDSKRPGKLLRSNKQRLNDYRLGARVEICIEPLQKEENLGPHELLLRVQMGIPGERDYYDSMDLVWDISKECTAWALRQRVAAHYCLPVEKIEIAKYFPERFEWLPISSWTQQISKRKRKKKQESLQAAPYHLKDGDVIGVKNLLLDDMKDFSTLRDDIGKEKQRQLTLEKKKSRQAERLQHPGFSEEKLNMKHRKPEVALSINVGVFR
uniref:Ubiquitin carboxyl-terminal hydrolase 40 n=1 Tax=Strigops habroptila TaxID=2489341 RepID=A0A672VD15_STRHB